MIMTNVHVVDVVVFVGVVYAILKASSSAKQGSQVCKSYNLQSTRLKSSQNVVVDAAMVLAVEGNVMVLSQQLCW